MSMDPPALQTAQAGFRPGEDLAPDERAALPAAPAVETLTFTPEADAGGTDFDVLVGYQMFLGRDPESSFVIADAKSSPVGAFIRALMGSGEFQSAVLDRLAAGRPLPHESASLGPAAEQIAWLFRHIRVPPAHEAALRQAADWRGWLEALTRVPGTPSAPPRAGAPQEPGVAARAADDGFVLVHLEQPRAGERIDPGAMVTGAGWAIAPADVTEVAVHLDDVLLTHARYGLPRPDVARSFPHYRHVDHCGFTFTAAIPADARLHPASQLTVSVRTVRGETGRKSVRVQPPDQAGPPKQAADAWPIRLSIEEATVDADRILRVLGWAAAMAPLASLTAYVGDVSLGEIQHGLPRPDIASAHPDYPSAAQSGFVLVQPVPGEVPDGPGFVRVEAQDALGRTRQAIVPVVVPRREAAMNDGGEAGAGDGQTGIECNCDMAELSADGLLTLSGWAIAPGGPPVIGIELDGAALGETRPDQPRPDVGRRYPGDAMAGLSGFSFSHVLAGPPAAGDHLLALRIGGAEAERRIERVVAVGARRPAQAGAGEMRLEIDQPVLDGDVARTPVRGALTISGWTIARGGVAGVTIHCDDRVLGEAYLGMRREDIGSAFPDYRDALLAGYALVLPPGALPEGEHRIRVVATARATGDEPPAVMERSFALGVKAWDALPPGGAIRTHMPPAEAAFGLALLERQGWQPRFEIAVTGGEPAALAATLASLLSQAYPSWTARVVRGRKQAAPDEALHVLQARARGRIVLGGRAAASPRAARGAAPVFVMRLAAGDILGADALLALASGSAVQRDAELIYADELRQDPAQGRRQPFFKPGWSPELLLSMNLLGRCWCATRALAARAGLDQATGDYDAALRLGEAATSVSHFPGVLLDAAPSEMPDGERAALQASLSRRGEAGDVLPGGASGTWRIRRALSTRRRRAKSGPLVSIIIPTCSARDLVRRAVAAIRASTAPARPEGINAEIIILDNTPARQKRARAWLRKAADQVIDMPGDFNWSAFNNAGARAARGTFLLFLNDDIEAGQPDWLEAMLEYAQLPHVGVVGARLLYPDGKLQHGGQYLADGHARHAFRFADHASPGPFGLAQVAREMISVTGACQMVRAETFRRLGGFEEAHSVVNNDLDFCLRAWQAGLSVIYTPHATLTHHELASRAALQDIYDEARFLGAWRTRFLAGDPYRSPRMGAELDHYGADPEPTFLLHVGRRLPPAADIARILAVKLDHIGDFLTALPALRSLAARFPGRYDRPAGPAGHGRTRAARAPVRRGHGVRVLPCPLRRRPARRDRGEVSGAAGAPVAPAATTWRSICACSRRRAWCCP